MKKIFIVITSLLVLIAAISFNQTDAVTITSAPYETFTIGPGGYLASTQTAYEPAGLLVFSEELNDPQDMYIKNDMLFVADTGNQRILKIDLNGNVEIIITNLNQPTGIHVDDDNQIYVADKGLQKLLIYDQNYRLIKEITRPTEPIFGSKSPFVPLKVSTGPRGVIYLTGEGSVSGVMQFNQYGEFLGYLATNPTQSSFYRKVLELFDQNLAPIIPISPENLALDEKGSIYTTSRTDYLPVKKFNIASKIVLSPYNYTDLFNISVFVNDFGNIYTITEEGIIQEYDAQGNLLFAFGLMAPNLDVLGTFNKASDIVVDSNYNLLVLDQGRGQIQILARSEFTKLVHDGLRSLNQGIYDVDQWENVLRMNSVFALANSVIARTYYRTGDYQSAMHYYQIASDKAGYSDAFWQVRNAYLQNYLGLFMSIGLLVFMVYLLLKVLDKKYQLLTPLKTFNQNLDNIKTIKELRFGLKIFKQPFDTFHQIKHEKKSSVKTALIIYGLYALVNLIQTLATGFLFNNVDIEYFNIFENLFSSFGLIMLFITANYLISSLSNGEGWFKDVFIGTAYALIPYIILTVPIIFLSHILTLNESFIYSSVIFIRDAWTYMLIMFMILEIHNFRIRELVKNILLTIFTMAVIVAILLLVYLLVNQMIDYIVSIIKEVIERAFS